MFHINKNIDNKTKIKGLKIITSILCVLLVFMLAGLFAFNNYYSKLNHQENDSTTLTDEEIDKLNQQILSEEGEKENSPEDEIAAAEQAVLDNLKNNATPIASDNNIFNILLIGTDNRENVAGDRSDSMILVSLNTETHDITMTSFMRDTYVSIPGHGNNRLNAAYAYGGADLLIETIQTNFKIEIDRYVKVGFDSFVGVIDAIGGVDIEVSEAERKVLNDYVRELNYINNQPTDKDILENSGLVHLDGTQALCYSRIRYVGNADFERTERQRRVLSAAFDEMKNSNIIELNNLLNELLPLVTTNVSKGECFSLLLESPQYLSAEIESNRVPYDGTFKGVTINKMSVLSIDFDENIKNLQKDIYGIE